jgi:histidyl-tRNA synthetase
MNYTSPKGTFDILPSTSREEDRWQESARWQYLEEVMRKTASDYDFQEIRTPLFESTELFVRGVGDSSDIVGKEMYTFLDKAGRSMTLRPEGTAPVIRAFLENKLYSKPGIYKFFYIGPMFRYERQQAGRYRQHHQFGAEAIGIGSPLQDVELIDMLCELYRRLGLKDLVVQINSVGDAPSRAAYKEALSQFLKPRFAELSEDSKVRFEKNMLRILDSKDPGDQALLQGAPVLADCLTPEAKSHFEEVLRGLDRLKVAYEIAPKLVRGLDYYNKTVFEITASVLGAHNAIGGGGRYDGLTAHLGGPDLPSIGFGAGIERLIQTLLKQGVGFRETRHPFAFFIPRGEKALHTCFNLTSELRRAGIAVEIDLSGKKIQHALQLAIHLNATYALVVGDQELASNTVQLKHLSSRETTPCSFSELLNTLKILHAHG